MIKKGADPNVKIGNIEDTALHLAARHGGNKTILKFLISSEADPTRTNRTGKTAGDLLQSPTIHQALMLADPDLLAKEQKKQ